VTVEVSDGAGGTDTQAIAVTVTDANEAPTISNPNPTANLVAFYTFDEPSGNVAADQVGGHDGTILGATHVAGLTGNALAFAGSSDVSVANSPDWNFGSGDFSIQFWVNFNSTPGGIKGNENAGRSGPRRARRGQRDCQQMVHSRV
jgi:hypothetical protein